MSAETIGLLAYGLRPAPLGMTASMLTPGAYTSMSWDLQMAAAHAGCHISAFCRNPLHPGPCKGWKHHLGLVSPGALHALEKIRHEKLESNRKAKVKALQDAGHAVPKKLLTPIVYDPAKNKHILQPDKITPGLGIPTKGLTPETAKATLDAIPTKAQVGAKLDAKHAAEAAAAVPKPTQAAQYLTITKAGLKPGDKVFLHGKGKTPGEGQLVTVRKIGGDYAKGYQFEGSDGKMLPNAGGPSAKWHLSPAPGESFPESPDRKVAANVVPGSHPGATHKVGSAVAVSNHSTNFIVRGHNEDGTVKLENASNPGSFKDVDASKIKPINEEGQKYVLETYAKKKGVPALGEAQKKATAQIDALTKVHAMASGKHVSSKQKADMVAKATDNAQLDEPKKIIPEGATQASADKIAAKLWNQKPEVSDHMHQGDLEKALAQDITDGVEHGKPTPVLDAAKEAALTLGHDNPGAVQALADAVHAKLGISGTSDTPAKHDLGNVETALGGKVADHNLSIAESTNLDHVKKTISGGNDNLPPEARAYVLSHMSKDVYDKHLNQDEKSAVLAQLTKAHQELGALPNKDTHQHKAMQDAEDAHAYLSGNPMPKHDKPGVSAYKPSASIMQQHGENLSKVSVQSSSPLNQLDAVEHLEPEEYAALSAGDKNKVQDILHNLEGMSDKPGISNTAKALKDTLGIPHNDTGGALHGDPYHESANLSPNAGAAPHVKQAIAYANGHQSATDTKKLAAYHKLTPAETAALDPNTKKLMEANLNGMSKKSLDPKRKAHVLDVLNKVQVAHGGGAGAGGGSSPVKAAVAKANGDLAKAKAGTLAAFNHKFITQGPGTSGFQATQQVFEHIHGNGTADGAFHDMAASHVQHLLGEVGMSHTSGLGEKAFPHLTNELAGALKGESGPTPLMKALHESSLGNTFPLTKAANNHPALSKVADENAVLHELSKHAGTPHASKGPEDFGKHVDELTNALGGNKEGLHSSLSTSMGFTKVGHAVDSLNLPEDIWTNKDVQALAQAAKADYAHAIANGLIKPTGVANEVDKIAQEANTVADNLAKKNGWAKDGDAANSFKKALFLSKVQDLLSSHPGAGGASTHTSPASAVIPGHVVPAGGAHDSIESFSEPVVHHIFSAYKSAHKGTVLSAPTQDQYDNLVAVAHHYAGQIIGYSADAGKSGSIPGDLSVAQVAKVVDQGIAESLGKPNENVLEKKILAWLQTPEGTAYAQNHKVDESLSRALAGSTDAAKSIQLKPGEKVQKVGGPGKFDSSIPQESFKPLMASQIQKSQDDYLKATGTEWNHDQVTALANYTTGAYHQTNSYLRGEDKAGSVVSDVSQLAKDRIKLTQSAMRPLQQNTLLKRGTGIEQFPPHMRSITGLKAAVGKTFKEPAFMSTTVGGEGGNFSDTVMLQIEAPIGTQAAWVKHVSHNASENEVILAAGSNFRILGVTGGFDGHPIQVRVRVVS